MRNLITIFCGIVKRPHRPRERNILKIYELLKIAIPEGQSVVTPFVFSKSLHTCRTPPVSHLRPGRSPAEDEEQEEACAVSNSMYWSLYVFGMIKCSSLYLQDYEEEAEEEECLTDDEILDVGARASTDGPNGAACLMPPPKLLSAAPTPTEPQMLSRAAPIETPSPPAAVPEPTPVDPAPAPMPELLRAGTCDLLAYRWILLTACNNYKP